MNQHQVRMTLNLSSMHVVWAWMIELRYIMRNFNILERGITNIDSRIDNAAHRLSLSNLLASLFLIFSLTGCSSGPTLVVEDPAVLHSSIHVGVSLEEKGRYPPSVTQTGKAIEFAHVYMNGGSNQNLVSGQSPIEFGNTTFNAPQQLKNEFNSNYSEISFRWRKFFGERSLGIELAGGVGSSSLGLRVNTPAQQDSVNLFNYGIQTGVGLIWRLRPGTSAHIRWSSYTAIDPLALVIVRSEIYVSQALGDNVALRVGYARWYMEGLTGLLQSDLKITSTGPTINLGVNF